MTNDVMCLSDLVPEYARFYKVNNQKAAHALHELFEELHIKYGETLENRLSLNNIFWVGGVKPSERKTRPYRLYFQLVSNYLYAAYNSAPRIDNGLINCYSETDEQFKNIPASSIYFSRNTLADLIQTVSSEPSEFLFSKNFEVSSYEPSNEDIKAFKGKELVSIQGLTRGLIEMIIEVDRAHRGLSNKTNPRAILLAASQLDLCDKPSKWRAALTDLAAAVEVEDFRDNRRTLVKYVGD